MLWSYKHFGLYTPAPEYTFDFQFNKYYIIYWAWYSVGQTLRINQFGKYRFGIGMHLKLIAIYRYTVAQYKSSVNVVHIEIAHKSVHQMVIKIDGKISPTRYNRVEMSVIISSAMLLYSIDALCVWTANAKKQEHTIAPIVSDS